MLTTYLLKTDESCVIDGISYAGIPLLVTPDHIFETQSDYLRELAVKRGRSLASVGELGKYLRTHVHVMDAAGLTWEQTHEAPLRGWRNSEAGGPKPSNSKRRYLNQQLLAMYGFLISAERAGLIRGVVGPLSPSDKATYPLPIEIKRMHRDGTPARYGYPLLYRTVGETDQRNATSKEFDELFVALSDESNPYLAERNLLIARYAENGLLRRIEATSLLVDQLPSREASQVALDKGEELTILLQVTKGMKARETIVDPQLVIDTWAFIHGERKALLRSKGLRFKSSSPIFLSWRTGKQLHPDSITNIFAEKQAKAGISRASIHRLRSKGSTDKVEALTRIYQLKGEPLPDEETLLLQVKELLGHASVDTSRKYIRREKKRRLDRERGEQNEVLDRAETIRRLDREIAIREGQLRRLNEQTGSGKAI